MHPFPDWKSILPEAVAPLPLAQDPDFLASSPTTVRAVFLRLDELSLALPLRADPLAAVAVHVDVLRIESACSFSLPTLSLHARRIEIEPGASLTLAPTPDTGAACRLAIWADE